MELYAKYLKERENVDLLVKDNAWASYAIYPEKGVCYIKDIYVEPEARQRGVAATLADEIAEKAKSLGCRLLVGSVDPQVDSAQVSRDVLRGYGMDYLGSGNAVLEFYKKEIN